MTFPDTRFFWSANLFPRVAFAPEGRLCFPSEARGVIKTQGCKGRPWKKVCLTRNIPCQGKTFLMVGMELFIIFALISTRFECFDHSASALVLRPKAPRPAAGPGVQGAEPPGGSKTAPFFNKKTFSAFIDL